MLLEVDVEGGRAELREVEASGPLELGLALHEEAESWRLDPLDPRTPFVLGMGPFVGGRLFGVHRLVAVFKSPQTRTLHVSALGGAAYRFMGMGADALAVRGRAPRPVAILASRGEVKLVEMDRPRDAYSAVEELYRKAEDFFLQNDARAVVVGPASFSTYAGALVSLDLDRGRPRPGAEDFAARGGPGSALARGHNVVAIAAGGPREPRRPQARDPAVLEPFGGRYIEVLAEKTVKYRFDPKLGTGGTFGVNYVHYRDLLPLFGYKSIYMPREERIRHAEAVLRLFWKPFNEEVFGKSRAWYTCGEPCPVVCKKVWRGKKVDYESLHAVGPFIGNYVFEEAVPLIDLVDRLGLDAIETGHVVAWLFDAVHHGLLEPEEAGLSARPAFDPQAFQPERHSPLNARLAGEAMRGLVEGTTEVLRLVAQRGLRAAAKALEERYRERVRAVGVGFRDLAVYVPYGAEGYMTPNYYWSPGMVAPMYVQGRYWTNYNPTYMPPEEYARTALERAEAEAAIDNAGICRFHRGALEPALPALYRAVGLRPPQGLYRRMAQYSLKAGAEPAPWESRRTADVVLAMARELGARPEDPMEWWRRYKEAVDSALGL